MTRARIWCSILPFFEHCCCGSLGILGVSLLRVGCLSARGSFPCRGSLFLYPDEDEDELPGFLWDFPGLMIVYDLETLLGFGVLVGLQRWVFAFPALSHVFWSPWIVVQVLVWCLRPFCQRNYLIRPPLTWLPQSVAVNRVILHHRHLDYLSSWQWSNSCCL